jgi:signal transduction histidine kinase
MLTVELDKVVSVMEYGGANVLLIGKEGQIIVATKQFADVFAANTNIQLEPGNILLEDIKTKEHNMPIAWTSFFIEGLSGKEVSSLLYFKKDNRGCCWNVNFRAVYHADGTRCIVALTRDVTRQKTAESKLVEQNKELKKINSELDRFVYSASHDLRAPLMSIKGLVNILKVEEYNQANFKTYIDYIENSVSKLDNFISDIVNYSHNSRLEIKIQSIDFNYLISRCISNLHYLNGFNKIKIETYVVGAHAFSSDYDRLIIILVNIISNSVTFHDPYKEEPYVKITISIEPNKAVLKIEDNGIGIADQHIDKVFQMFFRGNTQSRGSGLGLYIANEVTEKLKGSISLQSKLGIGTTLFIELPDLNWLATVN